MSKVIDKPINNLPKLPMPTNIMAKNILEMSREEKLKEF